MQCNISLSKFFKFFESFAFTMFLHRLNHLMSSIVLENLYIKFANAAIYYSLELNYLNFSSLLPSSSIICLLRSSLKQVMIRRRSMPTMLNPSKLALNKIYSNDRNCIFKAGRYQNFCHMKKPFEQSRSAEVYNQLPDIVLQRICSYLAPTDLINLLLTCRRFNEIFSKWNNFKSLEIRLEEYTCCSENESSSSTLLPSSVRLFSTTKKLTPKRLKSYHIRLITCSGTLYRLRTTEERSALKSMRTMLTRQMALEELTIWNACLSFEFVSDIHRIESSIETLKLWNCSEYFKKKSGNRDKIIEALLGLPSLKSILVLDSTINTQSPYTNASSTQMGVFSKTLAQQIRAPVENLQLTNLYLPLRAMEVIANNLGHCCSRLAIGCTFGKLSKRFLFLNALSQMKALTDFDFPPFIFHIHESSVPEPLVQKFLTTMSLTSIGIRHYNSSVLFRFIEYYLPPCIRILRIHHSASRIPNFAELGRELDENELRLISSQQTEPHKSGSFSSSLRLKKMSTGTRYSALSVSSSSICSASENQFCKRSINSHVGGDDDMPMSLNGVQLNGLSENCNEKKVNGCSKRSIFGLLFSHSNYISSSNNNSNNNDKNKQNCCYNANELNVSTQASSRRSTMNSCYSFMSATGSSVSSMSCDANLSQLCGSETTTNANFFNNSKIRKHSLDCVKEFKEHGVVRSAISLDQKMQKYSLSHDHLKEDDSQDNVLDLKYFLSLKMADWDNLSVVEKLFTRRLTIFAISEEKQKYRTQRLRKRTYCGVDVIYIQETIDSQEVLGRLALPMQLPHVYSKNLKYSGSSNTMKRDARLRIIKGDLVKPIPLSSLGMESDYEMSDWED